MNTTAALSKPSVPARRDASKLAALVAVYLVLTAAVFVYTFQDISHSQSVEWKALSSSTLLYASSDYQSKNLASQVKATLHIRTVDLLAPTAGKTVYELTGQRVAVSPTLLIPSSTGIQQISGDAAVQQELQRFDATASPLVRARWALIFMASIICLTLIFESEIRRLTAFLPLLGLVAIAALWGRCLHCSTDGSPLSTFAPVAGLLYITAAGLLFTVPARCRRMYYFGLLAVSAAVPSLQAVMLLREPKLCPSCLAMTFLSAAYFVSCLRLLSTSTVLGWRSPLTLNVAMTIALFLLLGRHALVLGGVVKAGESGAITVPSIIGQPVSTYFRDGLKSRPGVLYIVTMEGCSHCEDAKRDLARTSISWQKAPVCTFLRTETCFGAGKATFPTPLLLMSDKQGRIVFQREGWTERPEDAAVLEAQILATQRRILDPR